MTNDTTLKQAVLDALKWAPSVNAAHVGVAAADGVVTLTGHVQSYAEKSAAKDAARRVKAVKAVVEELEVKLPSDHTTGDADIAAAAISRMSWDSAIPANAVTVKVEKGRVTLTGDVAWHYQREAAADNVRGLTGVTGVLNQIAIKPKADASNIRDNIVDALRRSWFNTESIQVTADDGRIKLYGSVHSWTERDHAGTTAWAAPGVTSVENDIRVD